MPKQYLFLISCSQVMLGVTCLLAQNALANPTQTTTLPTEQTATPQENWSLTAEFDRVKNLPESPAVSPSTTEAPIVKNSTSLCAKFTPITNAITPNISPIEDKEIENLEPPTSSCAADLTEISSPFSVNQESVAQENTPNSEFESPSDIPSDSEEIPSKDDNENDRWHFKLQPYATIPVTVYGNNTVKGRTVNYHLNTGQLLDLLRVTASGRFEAWKGNLGFIIDGYYASLKGAGIKQFSRFPNAGVQSTLTFDQGIYDFALSYHFGNAPAYSLPEKPSNKAFPLVWFEPIAGVRLNDLSSSIETTVNIGRFEGNFEKPVSEGRTWFEPLLGGKFGVQTSDSLTFWMRGDASGFGIAGDTDLSWNFIAGVDWWVYRNISLQLAYRFYGINYGNGSGNNAFGFEESFNGPFLSATFNF